MARGRLARRLCVSLRRTRAAVNIQKMFRSGRCVRSYHRQKRAALRLQSYTRMHTARAAFGEMLRKARERATYEGQIAEAKARLDAQADEKLTLEEDKKRLEQALKGAITPEQMQAEMRRQQQEHSAELSRMLQQQQEELLALRDELQQTKIALRSEQDDRKAAEGKAEQAALQLSVERSNHQKLQRKYDLERSANVAAKERKGGVGGASSANVFGEEADVGGGAASSAEYAAEMNKRDEREQQLRNKLEHMKGEQERWKHKLERTQEEQRAKKKEWERERQQLKRTVENSAAEVAKRDQWLAKAKGIITEYQKRSVPTAGTPGGTPRSEGAPTPR